MPDEQPMYIALLREAMGNERAISFEGPRGEEAAVGDEITVEGVNWRILAVESEDPPWAGTLVCERVHEVVAPSEHPRRREEDDLPLHLRVVRAILEGQPTQQRMNQALSLATEVYELEANAEFED